MNRFKVSAADFDAKQTLECGQIFRFDEKEDSSSEVRSLGEYARVFPEKDGEIEIVCTDEAYFRRFFDFGRDYGEIKKKLLSAGSETLSAAMDYGGGIRILAQDLYETTVSFIISANNNIKRIKLIIERLCEAAGEKNEFGFSFPTRERLADKSVSFYESTGCGYRSEYLADTVGKLDEGFLSALSDMPTEEARKTLLTLKGVGPKVADCILLFGAGRKDVFPTDVWIKRVYHSAFEDGAADKDISRSLVRRFGELSGYAQQYLFYYYRGNGLKDVDKTAKK